VFIADVTLVTFCYFLVPRSGDQTEEGHEPGWYVLWLGEGRTDGQEDVRLL